MKIAYVITRADAVGGASVHVRDVARAMMARGHQVCVFLGGTGPVTEQLAAAGVPFRSLRYLRRAVFPPVDVLAWKELSAELALFGTELVSAHTAKAGWLARAAARVPVIYTPHGWSIGGRISATQGAVYTVAERIAAPWAAAIVCVSESERQLALAKRVGKPEQLRVIYNGVADTTLFADPGKSPPRILSVARLESPKDHASLLDALWTLRDLPWTLELVGDGPLEPELRRHPAAERTIFSGYLADPAPAYARAQLFVLSSTSEGFPRSILEAMRAGLPVVASDVGGVRESGVRAVSPRQWTEALAEFLRSDRARIIEGVKNRGLYESRFRLERLIDETEALYFSVLGRG